MKRRTFIFSSLTLLNLWALPGQAVFKAKIGLSEVSNPLLLTSEIAIKSTQLETEVLAESEPQYANSVLYYKVGLSAKTYGNQTVKSNAEQARLGVLVGFAKPVFDQGLLFHSLVQGQKVSGRALDIHGSSEGRNWSPSAYASELSLAWPVVGTKLTWTPRLTLGYEDYQFEQDEKDEFATTSNSTHQAKSLKVTNEFELSTLSRIQVSLSQSHKDFKFRPSRFSDGRSDLSLPTERLRNDRLEMEVQTEFDSLILRLLAFQQKESDLRQSALDATTSGGLASVQFSDFLSLKPFIEVSQEDRKFDYFRGSSAATQDPNVFRNDRVTSTSFRALKSLRAFAIEFSYKDSKTDSSYKDLSIKNQSVTLTIAKEI
ncbi:MAG: hypothetical protein IPK04_19915 [Bdellovibrionales bacterium]|jgi:hypothetical protein|nr:hypothetical protein [Bdellovibrionales bacterium]